MKQIAIYGKGGIGKSTVSANLSAALADAGARVLQVGCDPKHDSTRLLLDNQLITTVLDYMRHTKPPDRNLSDVLYTGYRGINCVEAGGPEPGVGCAGRGILSTFELLDTLGIKQIAYDITIYDVLGDVVCGGFAVPLRHEYAEAVYIVTSGEFMAIYAANNILKGVRNFDRSGARMGGILLNRRGVEDEEGRVQRFAEAVGLPILTSLPRSDQFTRAEQIGKTVVEAFPRTPLAKEFSLLAETVLNHPLLYPANPLSDENLENLVLGNHVSPQRKGHPETTAAGNPQNLASPEVVHPPLNSRYLSKSMRQHEPLHGCAFTGAVHTCLQIRDAITISHGPRSCAYITREGLASSAQRTRTPHGITLLETPFSPLISSDMSEDVVIFGGGQELERALNQAVAQNPQAVFVVTTCTAGIIGDDVQNIIQPIQKAHPSVQISPILTDGNINGDYIQGMISACVEGIGQLIDPTVQPEDDLVNIVAEKNLANNADSNYHIIADLLSQLGLRVNCRFVSRSSVDEIRHFLRGDLNLLAYNDTYGRVIHDYIHDHYPQAVFAPSPYPVGFQSTQEWLEQIAVFFHKENCVESILAEQHLAYQRLINGLKPSLSGTRVMLVTYGTDVDWVIQTALDLEMDVVKVALMANSYDDMVPPRLAGAVPVEMGYNIEKRFDDFTHLKPDLVLSNFLQEGQLPPGTRSDIIPMCPDVGFHSGPNLAERWYRLIKAPESEGWKRDASLF